MSGLTTMTLPLSNNCAIVRRPAGDIQALATVACDESISITDRLHAPLLVRATVTLPLEDRGAIFCGLATHVQALAAVTRDHARVAIVGWFDVPDLVVTPVALPLDERASISLDAPLTSRHLLAV